MDRRTFLTTGALGAAAVGAAPAVSPADALAAPAARRPGAPPAAPDFEWEEATVADLQQAMAAGRTSARALAAAYLARIEAMDRPAAGQPATRAVIEVNPDALAIADALDAERRAGRVRGPLHGIPVLLKDNVDTGDRMLTTAGSLALADAPAPRDAALVVRLRAAGAVILGKTNLSEWANFRSTRSSSGWSARGGQTRNPYALDRTPCGSSSGSGVAVAANYAALAVGTETDGSIVCPSSTSGIVGVKPTLGLVGGRGIVPIAHSQDTAGPMARTVRDAALLLAAMAALPGDAAPHAVPGRAAALAGGVPDYAAALRPDALRGARIGVARQFFGFHDGVDRLMDDALRALRGAGAVLVDPVRLPTDRQIGGGETTVLLHEIKADMADYLASRGSTTRHRTLADLIAFNEREAAREMPFFGQELFLQAEQKGPLTSAAYRQALARNQRVMRGGIDAALRQHCLDAIVAPTGGPAWKIDLLTGDHFSGGYSSASAVAGYPHVTVPAGFVRGLPVGLSLFGGAWREAALLGYAHAFEQATRHRRPPRFQPTAEGEATA